MLLFTVVQNNNFYVIGCSINSIYGLGPVDVSGNIDRQEIVFYIQL